LISINIVIPDEFAFQCQEPVDPSRGRRMLDGINWTVYAGEHWAILGANGSGKTSLLKALTGYMTPMGGSCTKMQKQACLSLLIRIYESQHPSHSNARFKSGAG
jgi:ABC-type molybdenum transport system ATPase subunit/photorepair protein PhrA